MQHLRPSPMPQLYRQPRLPPLRMPQRRCRPTMGLACYHRCLLAPAPVSAMQRWTRLTAFCVQSWQRQMRGCNVCRLGVAVRRRQQRGHLPAAIHWPRQQPACRYLQQL